MRILLTERLAGQADATGASLLLEGHEVLRCTCSPELDGPGATGNGCPLDVADVVIAVHGDPDGPVTQREYGAICALSRDVPLVVVGEGLPAELGAAAARCDPNRAETRQDDSGHHEGHESRATRADAACKPRRNSADHDDRTGGVLHAVGADRPQQ